MLPNQYDCHERQRKVSYYQETLKYAQELQTRDNISEQWG